MSIPNNRDQQESYREIDKNPQNNLTRNTETLQSSESYREGYIQGQNLERNYQQANLAERDNNNASRGLLLGIILTSLVAAIVGLVWYFTQRDNAPADSVLPVLVPTPDNTAPSPTPDTTAPSPQPQTTIIERIREVPIPVPVSPPTAPESSSPAPQAPATPNPTPNNAETGNDSAPTISEPTPATPPQGSNQSNTNEPGENSVNEGSAQ